METRISARHWRRRGTAHSARPPTRKRERRPRGFLSPGAARLRLYRALERAARRWTAALIAVSEEEVREALALGYGAGRVSLIRNGVPAADAGPVRVREAGELAVGFFGRLVPQKGADLLVEAAAEVVAKVLAQRGGRA